MKRILLVLSMVLSFGIISWAGEPVRILAIVSTVKQEAPKAGIKHVIPAGTAIQNARTSHLGDDLTRDGFHLSRPHGRYIAACTWLEAVLGVNPVGNGYRPEGMSEKDCKTAQKAAHKAVRKPFNISKIK